MEHTCCLTCAALRNKPYKLQQRQPPATQLLLEGSGEQPTRTGKGLSIPLTVDIFTVRVRSMTGGYIFILFVCTPGRGGEGWYPRPGQGYPPSPQPGQGYPPPLGQDTLPSSPPLPPTHPGQGYPAPARTKLRSLCCVPLAFTQEDCLVLQIGPISF